MTSTNRAAALLAPVLTLVLVGGGCSQDDREARRRQAGSAPTRAALMRVASAEAGARQFARCAACHAISPGAPDRNGPNLFGVMGRPIARGSARFAYTNALQRAGGDWTEARMEAWLADPQAFAPGTSMRYPGVADPLDRADLIAYLNSRR